MGLRIGVSVELGHSLQDTGPEIFSIYWVITSERGTEQRRAKLKGIKDNYLQHLLFLHRFELEAESRAHLQELNRLTSGQTYHLRVRHRNLVLLNRHSCEHSIMHVAQKWIVFDAWLFERHKFHLSDETVSGHRC